MSAQIVTIFSLGYFCFTLSVNLFPLARLSSSTLHTIIFGLMLNNVSSVFFMKQLDFLLLGIDHLVNTYNIIRSVKKYLKSSFTIMPIIVDNGFQGPQSSFNNFGDIC